LQKIDGKAPFSLTRYSSEAATNKYGVHHMNVSYHSQNKGKICEKSCDAVLTDFTIRHASQVLLLLIRLRAQETVDAQGDMLHDLI
jgi:hypothetical protein